MPKSEKSRADGRGFINGLFTDTPSGFARAISAPIPYDQLSGFHLGVVAVMALVVGEKRNGGGRQEQI